MATELAAGYVSLTVKLAKGGMADVTKEVTKAGKKGGETYSDEFTKQVEKDVGKKLPDTINKSTKQGGGWKKGAKEAAEEFGKGMLEGIEDALGGSGGISDAIDKATKSSGGPGIGKAAKEAADEFGKGFRDGVKQAIEEGGVEGALGEVNKKVKETTDIIKDLGAATGFDTTGIESASRTVSTAIEGIGSAATGTQTALEAFKDRDLAGGLAGVSDALRGLESVGVPEGVATALDQIATNAADARTKVDGVTGPLQELTALAGPDSKLYKAGQKLPLIGQFAELAVAAKDVNAEVETLVQKMTGLDVKLSALTQAQDILANGLPGDADRNAREALKAAQDAARLAASPGHGGGRAGGGSITGPGGPKSDIIPIWASSGEHVLSAADVAAMGGQKGVYAFRNMLKGFSVGGAIDFAASVGDGRPYLYGGVGPRYDCSGYMSAIYAAMLDKPQGTRYFTTESDFKALGFLPGSMPGAFNIGIRRGGGGRSSHMAGTLPDGTHVESGGSHGSTLFGSGAAGAEGFPLKFYLPVSGGDPGGMAGGGAGRAGGGGSGGGSGGGGGGGYTGYGPSGTNETGSNPYAKLVALEKQKQDAIAQIFGSEQIGTLGDIGAAGLKETLLPPGFSDPTQWKSTKSVAGLLQAIGTLSGDPQMSSIMGGIGDLMTGQGSAVTGFIPEPFGTMPMPAPAVPGFPGQPGGPGGTGGITIGQYNDNSGKGLQDATRLGAFENSPQTKHLSRKA